MIFFLLLLLSTLMSCASLTKESCYKTNWANKGEQDASDGKYKSRFTKYQQACQKLGVSISKANYIEGYNKGLIKFCTYESGYKHGEQGSEPFTECNKLNHSFHKGYKAGLVELKESTKKRELEEEQETEKKKAIESILGSYNSEQCSSDSDCCKDGDCTFNKCRHDESECTFNSDCKVEGDCSSESKYVSSINEWVSVDVCKY